MGRAPLVVPRACVAKGVGEVPIVPPMAAIANAIYDAIGVRMTSLPMSPPKVLAALDAAGK